MSSSSSAAEGDNAPASISLVMAAIRSKLAFSQMRSWVISSSPLACTEEHSFRKEARSSRTGPCSLRQASRQLWDMVSRSEALEMASSRESSAAARTSSLSASGLRSQANHSALRGSPKS